MFLVYPFDTLPSLNQHPFGYQAPLLTWRGGSSSNNPLRNSQPGSLKLPQTFAPLWVFWTLRINRAGLISLKKLAFNELPDLRSLPRSLIACTTHYEIIVPGSLRLTKLAVPFNLLEPSS
jgi:hypothetical protein